MPPNRELDLRIHETRAAVFRYRREEALHSGLQLELERIAEDSRRRKDPVVPLRERAVEVGEVCVEPNTSLPHVVEGNAVHGVPRRLRIAADVAATKLGVDGDALGQVNPHAAAEALEKVFIEQ